MNDFCSFLKKDRDKRAIISTISSIPSNYVGSKRRLLTHIWEILDENNVEFDSVFDAFSGSSMVSLLFKWMGKRVVANDLLTTSSLTAVSLLENEFIPISDDDLCFLCKNEPSEHSSFVMSNYKDKFFTENECRFLDRYKKNIELLYGDKFYCGKKLNDSLLGQGWEDKFEYITPSNDAKKPFDASNKLKSAFALFLIQSHINQNCFIGGRYYNGQTLAKMDHRINHAKNNGKEITNTPIAIQRFKDVLCKGDVTVFNSDIIYLLESGKVKTDLIYLDPPYGGASSDYAYLYRFLEEYLYEDKLENIEHIKNGSKRFSKSKGYQDQFEYLLSLCNSFKTWMISYNESSYADLDTIVKTIKAAGRPNVVVKSIPITYQYRSNKNVVDIEDFKQNYYEEGYKFLERGTEFLILAQK